MICEICFCFVLYFFSGPVLYDCRCLQSIGLFTGSSTIKGNSVFKTDNIILRIFDIMLMLCNRPPQNSIRKHLLSNLKTQQRINQSKSNNPNFMEQKTSKLQQSPFQEHDCGSRLQINHSWISSNEKKFYIMQTHVYYKDEISAGLQRSLYSPKTFQTQLRIF